MATHLDRFRHVGRRLRQRVLVHRRGLAALTASAAVLVAVQAVSPPPPETVTVWTTARDLPSGAVLGADDVRTAQFPPSVVPTDAVRDVRPMIGATLAAPMRRGEALTGQRVLGDGLLHGYPGDTAVPLRITDAAVVDLLRVGDVVSFVVADPDGRAAPSPLVDDVPVVAIPPPERDGVSAGTPGRLVVVAVPEAQAVDVAARAATGILIVVWTH